MHQDQLQQSLGQGGAGGLPKYAMQLVEERGGDEDIGASAAGVEKKMNGGRRDAGWLGLLQHLKTRVVEPPVVLV